MTDVKVTEFVSRSICPCPRCNGTGVQEHRKVTNYHDYYEEVWNEYCSYCGGEGRAVKVDRAYSLIGPDGPVTSLLGTVNKTDYEKLNGRDTSDIYKIGRTKN